MKKVLFSLFATLFLLSSCGGPDPVKFNDSIVSSTDAAIDAVNTYQEDFSQSAENEDFAAIAGQTDTAIEKIDAELAKIKDVETPKGGEKFKDAAIKACETLKATVEVGRKFSTLSAESSVDEYNAILEEFNNKIDEQTKDVQALQAAQAEFAKEAGYDIR